MFGFGKKKEEAAETPQEQTPAKEPGFFGRLGHGLEKTRRLLNTDIRDLFKAEGRLVDEELLDEIFAVLVRTDMGAGSANQIKQRIQHDFRGRVVHTEDILQNIQDELSSLMQQDQEPIRMAADGPTVILVVGVNGAGKTTSIAKLTKWFIDQGNSVVLGAGDTLPSRGESATCHLGRASRGSDRSRRDWDRSGQRRVQSRRPRCAR